MKTIVLLCGLCALLLLQGCAVDGVGVLNYHAKGKVTIPEPDVALGMKAEGAQVAEAVAPWKMFIDMLTSTLPYAGQTRRKAMEERVNYEEERSFSLFSLKYKPGVDPVATAPQPEPEPELDTTAVAIEPDTKTVSCPNCGTEMGELRKMGAGYGARWGDIYTCPNNVCGTAWTWKPPEGGGMAQWVNVGQNQELLTISCPMCHVEMGKAKRATLAWKVFACPQCRRKWKWSVNPRSKVRYFSWEPVR